MKRWKVGNPELDIKPVWTKKEKTKPFKPTSPTKSLYREIRNAHTHTFRTEIGEKTKQALLHVPKEKQDAVF